MRDGAGNREVGQIQTRLESGVPDVGDALRQAHAGHVATGEGPLRNAGDRQAVDRTGDYHRVIRAVIPGDLNRPVVCNERKLPLHRRGQANSTGKIQMINFFMKCLRRTEAVEAAGIIRPLRIAEIE